MSKPLLYIAAPYRAKSAFKLSYNINQARLMAQYYWLQDFIVICPHLNSAHFDGLIPDNQFLEGTTALLKVCSHIAIHPTWTESAGAMMEYEIAIKRKMVIHYTDMQRVHRRLKEVLDNE